MKGNVRKFKNDLFGTYEQSKSSRSRHVQAVFFRRLDELRKAAEVKADQAA